MDLDLILKRIEAGENSDEIRLSLGEKIMECLLAHGKWLTAWERTNFGLAINLLQSHNLRVVWTHVDFVCAGSDIDRDKVPASAQWVPTLHELNANLKEVLNSLRERCQSNAGSGLHTP